jgi:hypothetical protein
MEVTMYIAVGFYWSLLVSSPLDIAPKLVFQLKLVKPTRPQLRKPETDSMEHDFTFLQRVRFLQVAMLRIVSWAYDNTCFLGVITLRFLQVCKFWRTSP